MWIVYILQCADYSLYTWITTDLDRRLFEHNNSIKWAKYTKIRRPVKVVYFKNFENRSLACKEEIFIKKMKKLQKMELINKFLG